MSDSGATQADGAPGDEIQQKLKRHTEELIETDRAHLPKYPAPPSLRETQLPEAIRGFEARMQALFDEQVLSPVAQEELTQSIEAKLDSTLLDIEALTRSYSRSVETWLEHKKKMLQQADETSIHRWDMQSGIYSLSPPNKGKAITDGNPYVNIVDLEEFDTSAEVNPPYEHPPVWDKQNLLRWIGGAHLEVLGRTDAFIAQVMKDKQRMTEEAQGKRIPPVSSKKEPDLRKLKEEIRSYAKKLGFAAMGVTKIDRRYVSPGFDDEIQYDTVILLAHEMPYQDVREIPDHYPFVAFTSYRDGGQGAHKVADFIRAKGYKCLARMSADAALKYPPHVVNAGMGNYATFGIAIIPEVGTRTKIVAILVDAELPLDEPRDYNIEEFCSRCRSCQKVCPAGAIPKHERRFHGVRKRQTYHQRCWEYMATHYECMLCVRICPFSVLGYETCMEALPPWYRYNLHRDEVDSEFLSSPWQPDDE